MVAAAAAAVGHSVEGPVGTRIPYRTFTGMQRAHTDTLQGGRRMGKSDGAALTGFALVWLGLCSLLMASWDRYMEGWMRFRSDPKALCLLALGNQACDIRCQLAMQLNVSISRLDSFPSPCHPSPVPVPLFCSSGSKGENRKIHSDCFVCLPH